MSQAPYPQPGPQQPGPPFQQVPGQPYPPQPPLKPKKAWYKRPWLWVLVAIVLVIIAVSTGNGGGSADTSTANPSPVSDTKASERAAASASAAAQASASAAAQASAKAEASASAAAKASAEAAALKDPSSYKKLSEREFALLMKDTDSHKGEKIVVYGYVSQLDSATGPDTLRASTGNASKSEWYAYSENTVVQAGEKGMFKNVVKDDLVTIYATVDGSMSYGTQIGGNTTVPELTANIIKVTGSTS